jgi:RNA polymerase sigma-70 factor (ECF subfamily)
MDKIDIIPDNEVIHRVLQGEKEQFAILVRRHNQRLYRIALSIINNDSEIEDVMQTAYVKAYENLGKFNFKASFSTWLIRILINESLLRVRRRGRSVHLEDEAIENEIYHLDQENTETPLSKTMNTELKGILEDSIRRLPEKYRTVFIMREIEGMNVAETRDCLDITEANVKVRLNRAKALLRDSLSNFYRKEDLLAFHLDRCDKVLQNVMSRI